MNTSLGERLAGGLGTLLVLGLLGAMLLFGLAGRAVRVAAETPEAIAIPLAPPPQAKPRIIHARNRPAARAASPANLRAKPIEIVAPPPRIALVVPPSVVVAPVPPGASNRRGPGMGAGGSGNGLGGGGDENGDDYSPPRQLKGQLNFADVPGALRDAGVGGTVSVRYHVETDGHASGCVATASSGNAELDAITCRLIERKFRFEPSRSPDGTPVRSTIVERHSWINEHVAEPREAPPH